MTKYQGIQTTLPLHTHLKQSFQPGPIANNRIVQFFWKPLQGIEMN